MSALTLTGAIQGLMRRGSPLLGPDGERAVVVSIEDHFTMYVAIRTTDPHPARKVAWYGYTQRSYAIDLTDPTGRYHALLWLRERGHDLRWAEDEAEVLAWSVLSVVEGGEPALLGILKAWAIESDGRHRRRLRYDGARIGLVASSAGWAMWTTDERDDMGGPTRLAEGPETGREGRAAADRSALAAGYALRNEDGTLTLPTLPEMTHV